MTTTVEAIKKLEAKVKEAEAELEKFKAGLDKNPVYAFEWANGAFEAAAIVREFRCVATALKSGASLADVKAQLAKQVLGNAKYLNQCTSPTSNLMNDYRRAAKASLLDDFGPLRDW